MNRPEEKVLHVHVLAAFISVYKSAFQLLCFPLVWRSSCSIFWSESVGANMLLFISTYFASLLDFNFNLFYLFIYAYFYVCVHAMAHVLGLRATWGALMRAWVRQVLLHTKFSFLWQGHHALRSHLVLFPQGLWCSLLSDMFTGFKQLPSVCPG